MNHNLEIQKILLQKDEAPLPNDKINLLKQAITIADANNDMQWGFDLRFELIDEESNTARCVESFPAFAWMIDAYDSDPELFRVEYLIGKYRWMINESYRNVNISMVQIASILSDFKKRLRDNGYSLRTYYSIKVDLGFFMNNVQTVKENIEDRDNEEVNHAFDYWLGELYADIEYSLRCGKFEAAEQMQRSVSPDNLEYVHYPLAIYASFVKYYAAAGKFKKAQEYFLRAEECLPRLENDTSPLTSVSKMIVFLSVYNREKAWDYFERYVYWTIDCEDCSATFFAMDVLHLLSGKGERHMAVDPRLPWYRADGMYNIPDLYRYYNNMARSLVKRFDKRNGSNSFTLRYHKAKNIRPKVSGIKDIFGLLWYYMRKPLYVK